MTKGRMKKRKGSHWWWLKRLRDGTVVQVSGLEVPPDALRRWDSEAARRLNRMDRHRTKTDLHERREDAE